LYLLYICYPVIHRELQNVVYMKKKIDVQEKGGRVLSTSTCTCDKNIYKSWIDVEAFSVYIHMMVWDL
jgi:hypothetical protein